MHQYFFKINVNHLAEIIFDQKFWLLCFEDQTIFLRNLTSLKEWNEIGLSLNEIISLQSKEVSFLEALLTTKMKVVNEFCDRKISFAQLSDKAQGILIRKI